MCGLRIFAGPPVYYLPDNVKFAAFGLVYTKLHSEYELPSSTRFGQSRSLKRVLGTVISTASSKEKVYMGSEFLFMATCALDLTFLAPLTLEI